MDAGHGGASGRYDYLKEIAFDYAFLLTQLGVVPSPGPSPARNVIVGESTTQ
jgi:oligopeptidase B